MVFEICVVHVLSLYAFNNLLRTMLVTIIGDKKWRHFRSLMKKDIFCHQNHRKFPGSPVILNSYVWKSECTHFDQMYACSIISITPLGPFFVDSRPDWIFDFLKYLNLDSNLHFLPNFDQFWHIFVVPLLLGILLPTFNKTKDDKVDRDSSSISFKYSNSIHVFTRRIPHLTHLR